MQYQITYSSPGGHAEQLADGFCELLPRNTAPERLDRCEKAKGRPNNRDIQKACQFMMHVLEL